MMGLFKKANGLPAWVDLGLIPALNLLAALVISGVVIALIGEDPFEAMGILVNGAVGYPEAIGYTLYYTTNFIFTGLAVAIAFHAGLFNIGAEGQAYFAGLGVTLVCLAMGGVPFILVLPVALIAAMVFGGAWAFLPGYLQAKRGSHVVVTTIMFNFIAGALIQWVLVDLIRAPGQQAPESRRFDESTWLPTMQEAGRWFGIEMVKSPLNTSFIIALIISGLFYLFVWRTRWGYELRTVGLNERAASYAGIRVDRTVILAMVMSGGLAGFVAINDVLGVQHKLLVNFTGGVGFVGIAVALMGRNHPIGIFLAALLFGALYQGGSDLSFEKPNITREMVVVIQGLIILFCGALENLFRRPIERLFGGKAG
ncbi:ABC transporter permease [Lacibacterium aquatile]|uniref:ABC transporter permease n=1 Tax=Lacibacterium aquatile TaxID=1168082 RepID=A0ABW5DXA1_9PROT